MTDDLATNFFVPPFYKIDDARCVSGARSHGEILQPLPLLPERDRERRG